MKRLMVGVVATLATASALAQPAAPETAQPQAQQTAQSPAQATVNTPQQQPLMPKPVPRRQASDRSVVIAGIGAIVGLGVAIGAGGGDSHDSGNGGGVPSSP